MKHLRISLILAVLISAASASETGSQQSRPPSPQIFELKSADGTLLKATYFSVGKPGPGVILYHQSNRTRTSWDDVARELAAAGINALAVDTRGYGESGGTRGEATRTQQADLETAYQFLVSQPGVQRDVIGSAGAGWLGVDNSVQTARLHPNDIKSLVLMSGETLRPGIEFLHQAPQFPELFVVADSDEYPPTVEAMLLLYARSSSPTRKLIHYSAAQERLGSGMRPAILAKFPPRVVTAPISSRATRICLASSCSGLSTRSSKLLGTVLPTRWLPLPYSISSKCPAASRRSRGN